jgi:predicted PilT family ATPase
MERSRAAIGLSLPVCWAALWSAGCGYALGYRTPDSVTTIAVPIFNNETFPLRREIEYELTNAVRKEIQTKTHLELVDQDAADMVVYGTIREFQERVVAEGRRDEKIESNIHVTVELVVEDYRNKRRWRERVRVREPLSIERGETLEVAEKRAFENLAERILVTLESWEEPSG